MAIKTSADVSSFVTVVSPNGGETLTRGSTYRITWNSGSNIDKVTLYSSTNEYSADYIAISIPNTGYYDWTVNVGNTTNTEFKIQVVGYQTGVSSVSDTSDNFFTVPLASTPTPTPTPVASPSLSTSLISSSSVITTVGAQKQKIAMIRISNLSSTAVTIWDIVLNIPTPDTVLPFDKFYWDYGQGLLPGSSLPHPSSDLTYNLNYMRNYTSNPMPSPIPGGGSLDVSIYADISTNKNPVQNFSVKVQRIDGLGVPSLDYPISTISISTQASTASPTPIPSMTVTPTPSVAVTSTPYPTYTPVPTAGSTPISRGFISLAVLSLSEGDTINAAGSSDPDIYIANTYGYKRLFLNPIIFSFYGHLGSFSRVKSITAPTRDTLITSGLYRNCETNDQKVYGVEVSGEDIGVLHWINTSGAQAVADDSNFFKKVFCINTNEFNWYSRSNDYTSVNQVPNYSR